MLRLNVKVQPLTFRIDDRNVFGEHTLQAFEDKPIETELHPVLAFDLLAVLDFHGSVVPVPKLRFTRTLFQQIGAARSRFHLFRFGFHLDR